MQPEPQEGDQKREQDPRPPHKPRMGSKVLCPICSRKVFIDWRGKIMSHYNYNLKTTTPKGYSFCKASGEDPGDAVELLR